MANVSIIVRTKNEERWIAHCLSMLYQQDYTDFEVILVDNASTDHTVEIAKRYPLAALINIDKFIPGKALNDGIRASSGKFIVCLSAHCVPKNKDWLSTLLRNFENDDKLAGVYGRQLPLSFTDDTDKRDLLIVFGQDRRVQYKDYFFHNANSMLRREMWDKFPFDEEVTNIEDRVWGKAVTMAGYHIVYDPNAAVFHHHGLHQGNAPKRARGVVSIIERLDSDVVFELPESWHPDKANVVAVLPVQGEIKPNSEAYKLLAKSILALKNSKYVNKIYIVASDPALAKQMEVLSIDRKSIQNAEALGTDELLQKSLEKIESLGDFPEAVLYVNYDYIYRPEGLFDELIKNAQYKGYDTVFPGYTDYGHYWLKNSDDEYKETDPSMKNRSEREPVYRALYGQGCMTSAVVIRTGKLVGGKVGIHPIKDHQCTLRLSSLSKT
ncbi:MAG: glycosyltransferase family A protein [Bacteriovorax sp.]|nr:glycosyltransferase family A protein [Bacteriovorax sp.]